MMEDSVMWIAVTILIILFMLQRFGTEKVGYCFGPIICTWFLLNTGIGLYNFFKYDPTVIKAINPWEIVKYFLRSGKEAWISLGGTVLCITGTEALFADLSHFTITSIRISMCSLVYPTILIAYSGQASYLRHHPDHISEVFYKAIPGPMYWPVFVVAVLASIIASQAMISGTFSIIEQSLSHGCFPRVTVIHTSTKHQGQVYIPEVNYFLMIACVCVTLGFKTTENIGNAYGIAVLFAETITSTFMVLVMILIWKKHILLVITYIVIIMSVELTYLTSVLYKFTHGGYLPISFACFFVVVMITWNYVYRQRYHYEMNHRISPDRLRGLISQPSICKIPGLALFYSSDLVHGNGIPPIFEHYFANIPVLHSVLVFVSFKSLPINRVPPEERLFFHRVQPKELYVFRCVVRYGYTDLRKSEHGPFEQVLVERLKDFVRDSNGSCGVVESEEINDGCEIPEVKVEEHMRQREVEEEVEALERASKAGVVHLMGESEVVANKDSSLGKKIIINCGYNFLNKNLRRNDKMPDVSRRRLLKFGMTYEL